MLFRSDTFAPLGPCLVTADEITNPNTLRIRTELNGTVVQDSNTNDMAFDVPALIAYLSGSTTLVPGTVILTGTPSGVGMAAKPTMAQAQGPSPANAGSRSTMATMNVALITNPQPAAK